MRRMKYMTKQSLKISSFLDFLSSVPFFFEFIVVYFFISRTEKNFEKNWVMCLHVGQERWRTTS